MTSPRLLLGMVLITAGAGLVYELVIAAVASYVLGDSVRQFSLVVGVYLSALGLGAYLSRFINDHLAATFINVELGAALIGGASAPVLFFAYSFTTEFAAILYGTVVLVGVLVGLELPLLIRILERQVVFKELIARALTFDYAGALLGSLAFSLVLMPTLGLMRASLACGLVNALVALAATWVLRAQSTEERRDLGRARLKAGFALTLLGLGFALAGSLERITERQLYPGTVELSEHSSYQRIVLTRTAQGHRMLFLNGNLQFSSADEQIYHEALVKPALAVTPSPRRVLVAGGGDGLALRELVRSPDVEEIVLVDLDARVTDLATHHPFFTELNERALFDPRVILINEDAAVYVARHPDRFDLMVLDFPDPSNYSLGKLYSAELYATLARRLAPEGTIVIQASSPAFARRSFWCIVATLESAGLYTQPYHAFVPSFGEWGFVLGRHRPFTAPSRTSPSAPADARLASLFHFSPDMERVAVRANRLNNQALVDYYLQEWRVWN